MKARAGLALCPAVVRSLIPWTARGSLERLNSDCAVGGSWALKAGANLSALAPITTESAITLALFRSATEPGWRLANRVAEWRKNGRTRGRTRMVVASVEGLRAIVSWMNGRATS